MIDTSHISSNKLNSTAFDIPLLKGVYMTFRFILYKMPPIKTEEGAPNLREGYGYLYLDSNNPKFRLGQTNMTDEENPAGRTLNQVKISAERCNMF